MRTLIIADVHANYDALQALPPADVILCAGDLVTFGVEPAACVDWLVSSGAFCIRGEEDDAVAHGSDHALPAPLACAGTLSRRWTRAALSREHIAWLSALLPEMEVSVEGTRIGMVHAYPGDYNRYLGPTTEELDRLTRAFPRAGIIVVGHTHRPCVWRHGNKIIVNPGSVGQSVDPGKASYALLEGGRITLKSAPYPTHRAIQKIRGSDLDPRAQAACIRELECGSPRPSSRVDPIAHMASA